MPSRRAHALPALVVGALWFPVAVASTIAYTYDGSGRLRALEASGNEPRIVRYHTDAAGNVVAVREAGVAELALAGSVSPGFPVLGNVAAFTVAVGNAGPAAAQDVTVSITLDAPARIVALTAEQGQCSEAALACELGTLADSASVVITAQVAPRELGDLTLTAIVIGSTDDLEPGDDAASLMITALGSGDPNDTDGDGMPDAWELAHGLDPWFAPDADEDPDHDGTTNLAELQSGTNPRFNPAVLAVVLERVGASGVPPGSGRGRAAWVIVSGLILTD